MEIVVRGRNVEVPEHYRQHVEDKVGQLERFDTKLSRIDVELFHEKNPRQSAQCQRVEITLRGKGPVIRAESTGPDFYSALDTACQRLDHRLRRAADRRRVHRGRHAPVSVAAATAGLPTDLPTLEPPATEESTAAAALTEHDDNQPWRIVREKEHPADPMTVDDALFQMELVGHDFYLFHDKESGRPSVVYRRRGYDYGLLSLETTP